MEPPGQWRVYESVKTIGRVGIAVVAFYAKLRQGVGDGQERIGIP